MLKLLFFSGNYSLNFIQFYDDHPICCSFETKAFEIYRRHVSGTSAFDCKLFFSVPIKTRKIWESLTVVNLLKHNSATFGAHVHQRLLSYAFKLQSYFRKCETVGLFTSSYNLSYLGLALKDFAVVSIAIVISIIILPCNLQLPAG